VAAHFQSAHAASVHYLSYHFSGGTEQVIVADIPYYDVGGEGAVDDVLRRMPNGHIIAIAVGVLLILDDDLD
jgi:hypothetical protein